MVDYGHVRGAAISEFGRNIVAVLTKNVGAIQPIWAAAAVARSAIFAIE